MTQIETILARIEQLKLELKDLPSGDYKDGVIYVLEEELIPFINSLPSEQPSEDLEKAAKDFVEKNSPYTDEFMLDNEVEEAYKIAELTFKRGAQWQKEQIINKTCEWLNKNIVEYHPRTGKLRPIVNINAFREAMEDEQ